MLSRIEHRNGQLLTLMIIINTRLEVEVEAAIVNSTINQCPVISMADLLEYNSAEFTENHITLSMQLCSWSMGRRHAKKRMGVYQIFKL